jgi:peptidoglycan/LPS O-acetylase OafA/YrhL
LDGLRAVSIILVIGGHLQLSGAADFAVLRPFDGALGVRIFFVISGFIITYLFVQEEDAIGTISISRFYLRRFIRLYPVNIAFVAFLFLLTLYTDIRISNCQFVTALTYTKNFACGGWIDGHLWSLAVEEQFYLVWPLAFYVFRRRGLYLFALMLIAVAPFSRAFEYLSGSRLYALPTSNCDALMIGCCLALLCRDRIELVKKVASWRPMVGRVLAVFLMYVPIALSYRFWLAAFTVTLGPMLEAACAGYLLVSFVFIQRGAGFFLLNTRAMRGLGLISYSLYIWQEPIILAPAQLLGLNAAWQLRFLEDIVLCVSCATVSYFAFEWPLLALRARLHPRRSRRQSVATCQ